MTVEADRIVDVTVTHSDEGVDRRALAPDRIGDRFRGRPARPPLAVDAISGATISTERLIEAVEQRLARWREAEHVR
ncbi:MAG: FMN-binding protein [Myxococcales bacterium]|nr:FMN-binding protein [Myxococcales bacterium]